MYRNFCWYKLGLELWKKRIKDDTNKKVIGIEAKFGIEIRVWGM